MPYVLSGFLFALNVLGRDQFFRKNFPVFEMNRMMSFFQIFFCIFYDLFLVQSFLLNILLNILS